MICKNCNSQVPDDALFCPECGQRLNHAEYADRKMPSPDREMKPSNGKRKILLFVLVVCIVVGGVGAGLGYFFLKKSRKAEDVSSKTEVSEAIQHDKAVPEKEPEEEELEYDATEGGIHRYEFVIQDCGWNQAYYDSLQKGGYLVHINSQEEYDYILQAITSQGYENIHFYLGGRKADDEMAYYWVDENNKTYGEKLNDNPEAWCNGAWMAGEPSFADPNLNITETYLNIFYYPAENRWIWNDSPENITEVVPELCQETGYIVEYEG